MSDPARPAVTAEGGVRNIETQAWITLLDLHGELFSRLNRTLVREFSITLAKFDVLAQLYRNPDGLTQGILSRQLKVTGGNVTGLVRRLVADGLIDREMSSIDRRAFIVRPTARGSALYVAARARHDELLKTLLAPVSGLELDALKALLNRQSRALTRSPRGEPV
ncbi:MAG: MarR family transcriptional regulator [Sphingomonadales bacterium]